MPDPHATPYRVSWCKQKVRYRGRVAALTALDEIQRDGKQGHDEKRAYRCKHCGGWHLTKQDKTHE